MTSRYFSVLSLSLLLCACGGDDVADSSSPDSLGTESGDGDGDPSGDGDGDPSGDGDGDVSGDGDGDASGDGDGDPSGDGDGDPGSAPEVQQDSTYSVEVSTLAYGQGQTHSDWGGAVDGTLDLMLDIYEPTDAPPGRPAMVIIHGGGFTSGSKDGMQFIANYFAERGWVAMSIDYRLADERGTVPEGWADFVTNNLPQFQQNQVYAMYPAARDAKAAVRWLSANADDYQVDLDYVTALGGSAGSYLALMLGVTNPEDFRDELDAIQDPTLESTNLGEGAPIHTIIDHWGGVSHMEILQAIDGVSRFDVTDAPVSIVHGTADETVPFTEGEKVRDAYIDTGVPYAFYPLEGLGHGAWDATVDGMSLRELAFDFIVEQQGLTVLP